MMLNPSILRLTPSDWALLGLTPDIAGSARGYNQMGDVLTQTVDGRDLNQMWNEFQQVLTFHNQFRTALVDFLTFPVTNPIEDVPQAVIDDFEEASEFGEPKGIRGVSYFSMGYDFKWYDIAVRYTWMYLAEASAAQVESLNNQVLEADNRLLFNRVLRAIFNNVNRTATIRQQNVTVYPFYNNDGTTPPTFKTNTFLSTHNHYLTSGAATVDPGDLKDIRDHLRHHGYGVDMGSVNILLVNAQEAATIRTFRAGTASSEFDFVASAVGPPSIVAPGSQVVGQTPPSSYGGLPVSGRWGPFLVIEDDYIPAGYMVGFATGGKMAATNPVGLREHATASLRGLRLVKGREPDYPLIDSFYQHGFGTGVRHRGAGVVMQVTTNGTYAIPTAYA